MEIGHNDELKNNTSSNFPLYKRDGSWGKPQISTHPHSRQLAGFQSASTTPPSRIVETVKEEKEPGITPISKSQKIEKTTPKQPQIPLNLELRQNMISDVTRKVLEDRVRLIKRELGKCPFQGENGECFRHDIRCGERAQFNERENENQHSKPHHCLYTPFFPGDSIIIVEEDLLLKEFMLNTLKLFLHYDEGKVSIVTTAEAAIEKFKHFKLQNRLIGLIFISCKRVNSGTVKLLSELFERNINAEIVLTGPTPIGELTGLDSFLTRYIGGEMPFISKYLQTPIPTEILTETLQNLNFGKYL